MSSPRSPSVSSSKPPPAISSSYPLPPAQLIELYSDENIAKKRNPDPPKPIVDGMYTMFGVQMNMDESIIRPLESQGIKRLYPREYDHKRELKKINASILVNFLDLLDVLIKCPDTSKREEKCADIAMLFIQMHHLINELRPHQARETIRVTLHNQKRQKLEMISRLNKQIEKVNEMIVNYTNNIPDLGDSKAALEQLVQFKQMLNDVRESFDHPTTVQSNEKESNLSELDSLMCNIVDHV